METVIEINHAALDAAVASIPLSSVTSSEVLILRSTVSTSSGPYFSTDFSAIFSSELGFCGRMRS